MARIVSDTSQLKSQPRFRFVDAHHHLWNLNNEGYPWLRADRDMSKYLGDYSAICKNFLVEDLLDAARDVGLSKSVHIETADLDDPVLETAWVQSVADNNAQGFPHGIIGTSNLASRDCGETLDRHAEFANFRGIRMVTFRDPRFVYTRDFFDGLRQLSARGLIFDIDTDWSLMPVFSDLAAKHPNLQFVLGHCGFPKSRETEYFRYWKKAIEELAQNPNVSCKISGLGMTDHMWNEGSIRPWVETCLTAFGVDRCMFATNWPVDSLYSSYADLVSAYSALVDQFGADEKSKLFADNAERIYRI